MPIDSSDKSLIKKALLIGGIFVAILFLLVLLLAVFIPSAGSGFEKQVAVIPLKGGISTEGESGFGSTGYSALEIVELLEEAKTDSSIGVVFLDIDSPGGSVVATKQIVYKIREVRQTKPVVSYIGEVGASGAYYAAAASDYIIADADSITGSIGVISILPSITGLLEKIGVDVNVVKAGKFKATGSMFTELSEDERQIIQTIVLETFEQFKSDVLSFRSEKLSPSRFETVADGRILSGRQAKAAGLVDELLPRTEAIKKAAELGGIKGKPVLKKFEKPAPTLFDLLSASGSAFGKGLQDSFSVSTRQNVEVRT